MRSNDIYATNKEKENGLSSFALRLFWGFFFRNFVFVPASSVLKHNKYILSDDHSAAMPSDAANELQ